MTDADI